MSATPATREDPSATRPPFLRNLLMWMLTFLVIPIAGYVGTFIVGRVDNLLAALLGGAFVGLMVGLVQALVSRRRLPLLSWTIASAVGMSVGVAAGTLAVGYQTSMSALALIGLITGAVVGLAQTLALPATIRFRWLWLPLTAALWPLAWTVTTLAGINVQEQFIVFGASGSFVYTLLSGLALQMLIPQPATRPPSAAPVPALPARR
jgi:hypothetical protein